MKKSLMIVMAALSMLLTQCRKTEQVSPATPAGDGQVNITLDVDGGGKADVNTLSGVVTFKKDDVIYVASDGKYVGCLTYSETTSRFEGALTSPVEGKPLYFYFLGNKGPATLETGATNLTADISVQSDGLPVISGAPSNRNYTSDVTGYSARLLNKCALVKFNVAGYKGTGTVTITGMNNNVTVNLKDNSFNYGKKTDNGELTLNKKTDSDYWAILLPQDKVDNGNAYSSDSWSGKFNSVPAITENAYLTNNITVTLEAPFSVAANTKVEFAPGNLYWNGRVFKFETDQWDYTNTWKSDHVSYFYWSKNAAVAYAQGYSESGTSTSDVFFTNNKAFKVDGYDAGTWRTLSKTEWEYLLQKRTNADQLWAYVTLDNGKKGLVILPDGSTVVASNVTTTALVASSGAAFLPAAGYRQNASFTNGTSPYGDYWSITYKSDEMFYYFGFTSGGVFPGHSNVRSFGFSVRLVR